MRQRDTYSWDQAADEQGQLGSDIMQPSAERVHWKTALPSPEGRNDDADSSDDREEMASPKVGRSRSTSRSKRLGTRHRDQEEAYPLNSERLGWFQLTCMKQGIYPQS